MSRSRAAERISVVVPSYNHERFVGAAIRSIIDQSRPPDELVVIDDGSRDGSVGVIERQLERAPFPARLIVRANRGLSATLNEGLRLTDGTAPVIERVAYEHVIAGAPRSLFHDRDGNVWVGMRPKGLLRLAERFVDTDVPLEGLTNDGVRAMAASDDGSVWIGTGHSLLRFTGASREVYDVAQTRVLHGAGGGAVWAVTTNGLHRIENRRLVPVAAPPGVRWDRVTSMAVDPSGTLWLCFIGVVFVVQFGSGGSRRHCRGGPTAFRVPAPHRAV